MSQPSGHYKVAVLIPCLNEEITIGKVVEEFKQALPKADIYVFDNNSTDRTAEIAASKGAIVIPEKRPGKGFVIDSMFRNIEADYYLMVDGDDTYSAPDAPKMLQPLLDGKADMTVGTRLKQYKEKSFRPLHVIGNHTLTGLVNRIFKTRLTDMLSGYRGMTRELVKTVPILSSGFEVETELTIRTLENKFVIIELPLPYYDRPEGSFSKLRTFRDGFRVVGSIIHISRVYKPFTFFGLLSLLFGAGGLASGLVVVYDFMDDRYVEHVPLAILATGCMIVAFGSLGIGIVINTINQRIKEVSHLLRGGRGGGAHGGR